MRNSTSDEPPRISEPLGLMRELLARGDEVIIRTAGQSMWPTIRDGEEVIIAPVMKVPHRGDIILFEDGGRALLHRIVNVKGAELRTRGDAAGESDAAISVEAIIGVAVARLGFSGRLPIDGRFGAARARLRHAVRPLREVLARLRRRE